MNSTCLIWDCGLFPYFAAKLAEGFDHVLYFTPYQDSFPLLTKASWGEGLPGVERTNDFFDHVEEADVIVFPDVGAGDLQMYLRAQGKAVWGPGHAELLELDRVMLKKAMRAQGMNLPKWHHLVGTSALQEHLQDPANEDQYVKVSEFRGNMESFKHRNWWLSEPRFRAMDHKLGPLREQVSFVVEEGIEDAVEVGYDNICIDGQYPGTVAYGYECKDIAYVGRVCAYDALPAAIRTTNAQLAPYLKELGCRSMFSTELRVTKDGEPYLIDPTLRCPSPPSEAMLEVFTNWPEIVIAGAHGTLVEPEPRARFVAEIVLRSNWAQRDFLAVRFPDAHRPFVKLHGHAMIDGVDYVVALGEGMSTIGAAVGLGNTLEEAIEQVKEVAKSVEGHEVEYEDGGLDELMEQIEKGVQHGIDWD